MYNNGLKMMIMDQVNKCSYPPNSREYMTTAIMDTLNFPEKQSQPKTIPTKIGNDLIIVVYFPMSVPFQASKLEVLVKIFFMKNVPYEPPQFFVDINPNIGVNSRNQDIDPSTGRIMVHSLRNWNQYCTFRQVLEEIRKSFGTIFPIFKITKPQVSSAMPMPPYANYQNQNAGGVYQRPTSIYGQAMINNSMQPSVIPPYQQQPQQQPAMNVASIYGNQQRPMAGGVPGYGTSTVPLVNSYMAQQPAQSQMPVAKTNYQEYQAEDPEKKLRNILIDACLEKVKEPINKEKNNLEQQTGKLNNYQNQFKIEIDKISQFTNNSGNINQYFQEEMNKINNEIAIKKDYLSKNDNVEINGSTFMNYLIIDSPDKQEMSLIAKEASYIDFLSLIKKFCEKGAINYEEGKKLVRIVSKDLFRVSYKRKKICGNEN